MNRLMFASLGMLISTAATAADVCPVARQQQFASDYATRIAAIACNENVLWYRPFIDADGLVASATVAEGETSRLGDGATEAWRRVAMYWRDSGLLSQMASFAGATQCAYAAGDREQATSCRAFVIDIPWSAAFVSYVMKKADLPGFQASPSHFDYVRDAYLHPQGSPFLYLDPATTKPAAGDLLCYVRMPATTFGYVGLRGFLDAPGRGPLNMHCDIVVAANPDDDRKAYLIGGNIQQGVTMRLLNLNRNGLLWALPQRLGVDPPCSPDNVAGCNFSRQDWAVLLKLKSPTMLAQMPRPAQPPPGVMPTLAPQPACCVNCVVGAEPPVPRCPNPQPP